MFWFVFIAELANPLISFIYFCIFALIYFIGFFPS